MNRHAPDAPPAGDQQFLRRRRLARECALQFLYQADLSHERTCSSESLAWFWEQIADSDGCPPADDLAAARPFAERLVLGALTRRDDLDARLAAAARNWTIDRMNAVDRNILRLAVYEILFCDDIPALASLDEAIELAKQFGDRDSPRFVNGILDRIYTDSRQPPAPAAATPDAPAAPAAPDVPPVPPPAGPDSPPAPPPTPEDTRPA